MKMVDISAIKTQTAEILKDLHEQPVGIKQEGTLVGVVVSVPEYERMSKTGKEQPVSPSETGHKSKRVTEPLTGEKLLKSGLIGKWKDRTDIKSSQEYARELRNKLERRISE